MSAAEAELGAARQARRALTEGDPARDLMPVEVVLRDLPAFQESAARIEAARDMPTKTRAQRVAAQRALRDAEDAHWKLFEGLIPEAQRELERRIGAANERVIAARSAVERGGEAEATVPPTPAETARLRSQQGYRVAVPTENGDVTITFPDAEHADLYRYGKSLEKRPRTPEERTARQAERDALFEHFAGWVEHDPDVDAPFNQPKHVDMVARDYAGHIDEQADLTSRVRNSREHTDDVGMIDSDRATEYWQRKFGAARATSEKAAAAAEKPAPSGPAEVPAPAPEAVAPPADNAAAVSRSIERLREARQFFRENVGQVFRTNTQPGRPRVVEVPKIVSGQTADSAALSRVVRSRTSPGAEEAWTEFERAVGGRPNAMKAVEDYLANDAIAFAGPDGKVNPARVRQFLNNFGHVLEGRADLRARIQNVGAMQEQIDATLARTAAELSFVDEQNAAMKEMAKAAGKSGVAQAEAAAQAETAGAKAHTADVEKRFRQSAGHAWVGGDPQHAIGAIIEGRNPLSAAQATMVMANRLGVTEGVNRAAWDYLIGRIQSHATTGTIKQATAAELLANHAAEFEHLLGSKPALQRARDIVKAAEIAGRNDRQVGRSSITSQASAGIPLMDVLSLRTVGGPMGALANRILLRIPILHLFADANAVAKVNALMQDALTSNETARLLMTRVTQENYNAVGNRLRLWMASKLPEGRIRSGMESRAEGTKYERPANRNRSVTGLEMLQPLPDLGRYDEADRSLP